MTERSMISADFEVIRVQTMASNAIRVVLEMPEHMIPQMALLAECQRNGVYLHGEFTAADTSPTLPAKPEQKAADMDKGWAIS